MKTSRRNSAGGSPSGERLTSGWQQVLRGEDRLEQRDGLFSPVWVPGHAWELGHRKKDEPKANCAAFLQLAEMVQTATHSERAPALSGANGSILAATGQLAGTASLARGGFTSCRVECITTRNNMTLMRIS